MSEPSPISGESSLNHSDELGEKTRQSALWMGAMTVLWQGLSWGLTLASARYLLPSDYGVLALAETFTPYISLLATLSVGTWLIQESSLTLRETHGATLFSSVLSMLVAVFAFLLCPFVAEFYQDPSLVLPFRLICVVFLLRGLSAVPDACLRRELRFKELSILQLIVVLSRGILQLVLAILGFGFWSLILGMLASEAITAISTMFLARSSLRIAWTPEVWKKVLKFGVPASLSAVCWVVFTSADNVIVGKFFGTEMLGVYAMAYYLANLPMSKINAMFRSVSFSYLSRLKEIPSEFQQKSLELNRIFCFLVFPVLGGMALVAEEAIPLLFGAAWSGLVTPLQVLSVATLFRVVVDSLPTLLAANGKAVQAFYTQLLPAIILPLGFFFGAQQYGIQGVFGAWLALFPLVMVGMIVLSQKELNISSGTYLWNLRGPVICTLIMSIAVFAIKISTKTFALPMWLNLTAQILVGVLFYAAALFGLYSKDANRFLKFFVKRESVEGALS